MKKMCEILPTIKVVVIKNMKDNLKRNSIIWGFASSAMLLAVYFTAVGLISGIRFAGSQFSQNWYFIVGLAFGFGIQVSLYVYLKQLIKNRSVSTSDTKKTVAITGMTSTLSMISCCAHYLVNILPILGIAGTLSIISQYQKELFGIGLLFNLFGISYIIRQIIRFKKQI